MDGCCAETDGLCFFHMRPGTLYVACRLRKGLFTFLRTANHVECAQRIAGRQDACARDFHIAQNLYRPVPYPELCRLERI
jgi:hypothetical protein